MPPSSGSYLPEIKAVVARMRERDFPHKCPCCGHSGPVYDLGNHWDGCPMEALLLAAMDED